jgi:hypothetical protein
LAKGPRTRGGVVLGPLQFRRPPAGPLGLSSNDFWPTPRGHATRSRLPRTPSPFRPWFLLVPQYVARKAFFLEWLNNKRPKGVPKPAFVAPTQRPYMFTAPDRPGASQQREGGLHNTAVGAGHCGIRRCGGKAGSVHSGMLEVQRRAVGLQRAAGISLGVLVNW